MIHKEIMKRKFRTFAIKLNKDEGVILQRLRCEYAINISKVIKLTLKEKLEELDKLKAIKEEKASNVD